VWVGYLNFIYLLILIGWFWVFGKTYWNQRTACSGYLKIFRIKELLSFLFPSFPFSLFFFPIWLNFIFQHCYASSCIEALDASTFTSQTPQSIYVWALGLPQNE